MVESETDDNRLPFKKLLFLVNGILTSTMASWWNENDYYGSFEEDQARKEAERIQEQDAERTRQMIKEYYKRLRLREKKQKEQEQQHLHDERMKQFLGDKYLRELSRMDAERKERDARLLTSRGYGKHCTFKRLLPGNNRWKFNARNEQEPHYVSGIALFDSEINRIVSYSTYN